MKIQTKITKEKLTDDIEGFDFLLTVIPKSPKIESNISNGVLEACIFLKRENIENEIKKDYEKIITDDNDFLFEKKYGERLFTAVMSGLKDKFYKQ